MWGVRCYADLSDLPEAPDHLALLVPNEQSLEMLETGGRLGARSASHLCSGIWRGRRRGGAKASDTSAPRHRRLMDIAAVGPNCMGLAVGRLAVSAPSQTSRSSLWGSGPVAALTQSGTLAQTFSPWSRRCWPDSRLSRFLRQSDLSQLRRLYRLSCRDPHLRVITCYVELVIDGKRFLAAAEKARRNGKHIVVVKTGGTEGRAKAAFAHTGSLAGSRDVFDAFARDVGIVRGFTRGNGRGRSVSWPACRGRVAMPSAL